MFTGVMRASRIAVVILLTAVAASCEVSIASITILQDVTAVTADDVDTNVASDIEVNTGVGGTAAVTKNASLASTATSVFSLSGDSAIFTFTFDQIRTGNNAFGQGDYANGSGNVHFFSDVAVPYSASGSYLSTSGRTHFESLLGPVYDLVPQPYRSAQVSTDGGDFDVGGMAGDDFNFFSGSLTGMLVPFRVYTFAFLATTEARVADDGATAGGSVTLIIGDPPPPSGNVPEPTSVVVWSLLATVFVSVGSTGRRAGRG